MSRPKGEPSRPVRMWLREHRLLTAAIAKRHDEEPRKRLMSMQEGIRFMFEENKRLRQQIISLNTCLVSREREIREQRRLIGELKKSAT